MTCQDQEDFFWHSALNPYCFVCVCSKLVCFFLDDEHPTEHVHRILAEAVEEYLRKPYM
jgi:phospholipase/lecithinase/hemolysin